MKERKNRGWAVVALGLGVSILLTACSTDWVGQAEEIVAALIPAATNVVALAAALEGRSVSTQDLQTIQNAGTQASGDLQLVQALIQEYQKADAATKPGVLNKIQTAIGTVQSNLEALLPALHIKDEATQAKITAVVGIVLSEVQSLAAIVPLVSGGTNVSTSAATNAASMGHPMVASGQSPHPVAQNATRVGQPKAPLAAREFVVSYNATMTAKTGKAELDRATAGLKIHQHSKVARWVTAGVLK